MIVRTLPVAGKRSTAFPRWFVQVTGFLGLMRSPASEATGGETEGVCSLILRDFLHHGVLHPVLKGLPVLLRCKGVSGCSQEVCGDLTGVWIGEEENPSPTPMSTFSTALPPFCGSRIHWIWKAASSLRGFGAEMSSRTRVSPCFHVRHLGKWGTPVFP